MFDYDIAIVGGGMVGLALARALGESELRMLVLDRSAPPAQLTEQDRLRVSAISRSSQNILKTLGCWTDELVNQACAYDTMTVWEKAGEGHIHFDAADSGEPDIGHIIPNADIRQALWQSLEQLDNVTLMAPVLMTQAQWHDDHVKIELSQDQHISVRMAIAADGANSWLRQQYGLYVNQRPYQHHALVATIATENDHQQCARQVFLDSGPLAFLPLKDNKRCSIVWSTSPSEASRLSELPVEEFEQELTEQFGGILGALKLDSDRLTFPLVSRHASRYIGNGFALVGDAAHTIHPLAGQGVNLGLLDAASLTQIILDALNKRLDYGNEAVLRPYERWRRSENQLMLDAMQTLKTLFTDQPELIKKIRGLGMNLVNQAPPVKQQLIKHAMGLAGDLPELAKATIPEI